MPVACSQPSRMSLADCISHWPSTTRWPWFGWPAAPRCGSGPEGGDVVTPSIKGACPAPARERTAPRRAERQAEPRPRAHAADADHLAGEVDVAEALQQMAAIGPQRL